MTFAAGNFSFRGLAAAGVRRVFVFACLFLAGLCMTGQEIGHAQDVVAVLSSEGGPYRQALEGFRESMGRAVPVIILAKTAPEFDPAVKVAVLFGARASLAKYPPRIARIYCMAPGVFWDDAGDRKTEVFIQMAPQPLVLLSKLKEIQPAMRKLAVFWISQSMESYFESLHEAAGRLDIKLMIKRLETAEKLPEGLRSLPEVPDAIWLPPDPALVTATTFVTLKDFSISNKISFYAPTDGLVEKGALASVSVSFMEIGRAAAKAAALLIEGKKPGNPVYPEKIDVTLNMSIAKDIDFVFRKETVRGADYVLP